MYVDKEYILEALEDYLIPSTKILFRLSDIPTAQMDSSHTGLLVENMHLHYTGLYYS